MVLKNPAKNYFSNGLNLFHLILTLSSIRSSKKLHFSIVKNDRSTLSIKFQFSLILNQYKLSDIARYSQSLQTFKSNLNKMFLSAYSSGLLIFFRTWGDYYPHFMLSFFSPVSPPYPLFFLFLEQWFFFMVYFLC